MLTVADKFYIDNNMNKSVNELQKDLGKDKEEIKSYLKKSNNKQLKGMTYKGCAFMTPGSSEKNDEIRQMQVKLDEGVIHKPLGEHGK